LEEQTMEERVKVRLRERERLVHPVSEEVSAVYAQRHILWEFCL